MCSFQGESLEMMFTNITLRIYTVLYSVQLAIFDLSIFQPPIYLLDKIQRFFYAISLFLAEDENYSENNVKLFIIGKNVLR